MNVQCLHRNNGLNDECNCGLLKNNKSSKVRPTGSDGKTSGVAELRLLSDNDVDK